MKAALRIEPEVQSAAPPGSKGTLADQLIFFGIFGLLGFAPLAFGTVEPWSIVLFESAAAILFVSWAVSQAKESELRISPSPLFAPMGAFAALIALQILSGRTAYYYQTVHDGMLYCAYGVICFLVVQCLRKTSQVNFLATAASAYGLATAVYAIFQSITSQGKLYWLVTPRSGGWIYGPYVNHNHYAGLMEMLIPIPLVAAFTHLIRERSRKMLALGGAAVMASTIFLSGSRGGMIAFLVQIMILGLFLVRRRKSRRMAFALTGFVVVLVGIVIWLGGRELGNRVTSIRSETSTEISGGTRLAQRLPPGPGGNGRAGLCHRPLVSGENVLRSSREVGQLGFQHKRSYDPGRHAGVYRNSGSQPGGFQSTGPVQCSVLLCAVYTECDGAEVPASASSSCYASPLSERRTLGLFLFQPAKRGIAEAAPRFN